MNQTYRDLLLIFLLLVNVIDFSLFGWDKRQARQGGWRIPERTLLLWAVLGGSIGGLLGMLIFRHKTRHMKFKLGIPFIMLVQGCILNYFM